MKGRRDISLLYGTRLRWMSGYNGATTLSLMTPSIMAFVIMTQNSILTLSIMTLSLMTHNSIITLSIMTHNSIITLSIHNDIQHNDTQHNDTHLA